MNQSRLLIILSITLLTNLLFACIPKPQVPISYLEYKRQDSGRQNNLLILLRGRGGSHRDFEKYGFIDEIRARNLSVDIICPDAHFGYYKNETLPERLKFDIIDPARKAGYEKIWLAGVSMGGLGSLFHLRQYHQDIDGVILISPFVGWAGFIDSIKNAGGIDNWQPDPEKADAWQQKLWSWLKVYHETPEQFPPIYLAYAMEDEVVEGGPELLDTILPPERVLSINGSHNHRTFKKLWSRVLTRAFGNSAAVPYKRDRDFLRAEGK